MEYKINLLSLNVLLGKAVRKIFSSVSFIIAYFIIRMAEYKDKLENIKNINNMKQFFRITSLLLVFIAEIACLTPGPLLYPFIRYSQYPTGFQRLYLIEF
jgi:hypothetical protein